AALLQSVVPGAGRLTESRRRPPQSDWRYRALSILQQTPLERRALADAALRILKEYPGASLALLALREGDALAVYDSVSQALVQLPPSQAGILSRVLSHGHPLIAREAVPRAILGKLVESCPPVTCAVAVPLQAGVEQGETIGALGLASETAGQLGEENIPELETLSHCLVVALGGAQLLQNTQWALQEQILTWNVLVQVGRQVARSLDPEKTTRELLEMLVKLTGAEEGYRLALDETGTHLRVADALGVPPEDHIGRERPLEGTLMEWVMTHQQTLWIPDTRVPGWYTPIFAQYTRPIPRNLLMVPMYAGGRIVGALALTNKRPGTFTAQDVQVAENVASWLSHVLENARLYAQSRRQFQRLEQAMVRAGQALSSGYRLRETLEAIVRTAVELVDGDAGSIDLADPDGRTMRLAASHGFIHECLLPTLPMENSLVGTVFRTGQPLIVDDMLSDARVARRVLIQRLGVRSGAFIPLEDDAGRLGTLSVMRRRIEPFSAEEAQILRSFAQRAATAIRTARWREEILQLAETLETIMQATEDLVIVADSEGALEYANPRARALWAQEGQEDLSSSPETRETLRRLTQRCQRALAGEIEMPFVFPWITPKGRRYDFSVSVTPLEGHRYLITACDVTEISTLERFYQALVRRMHHSLRSPLATVLATLQLLQETPRLSPEQRRQCLERALEQLQTMKAQLRQLEMYSFYLQPVAAGNPEQCDVRLALEAVLHDVEAMYPHRTLRAQWAGEPLPTAVPPDLLARLLHRAFSLVLETAPHAEVEVRLNPLPSGVCLEVRVPNTGGHAVPLFAGAPPLEDIGREQLPDEDAASLSLWAEWVLIQHLVEGLGGRLDLRSDALGFALKLELPARHDAAGLSRAPMGSTRR
ncbi:MAG: GAF domain-containing protein, partial [Anaerolineae bacterium]